MSLHEGQYVTLTFVVRTPSGEQPGDDPRTLLNDDEAVMFWGHEDGISEKALELGADVASWHDGPDVERDPRVTTWANGFGRWHARVPRHAAGPLIAARRAIRDELLARNNEVARHFYLHLERAEEDDTEDTIVYREPATDVADCTSCATDQEKD